MKYPASRNAIQRFLKAARAARWSNFLEVRETFGAADLGRRTGKLIFDIGGNKYRLIATVDFEEGFLVIEKILTHEQYDREMLECP